MDLANDCVYEILTFLVPEQLLLCYQLDSNFNSLCKMESLWKQLVDKEYKESFKQQTYYETCRLYYPLYQFSIFIEKKDISLYIQRYSYFDGTQYLLGNIGKNKINSVDFAIVFKNRYDIDLYRKIQNILKNIKKYDQIRIHTSYPFSTPQIVKIRGPHKDEFVNHISNIAKKNLEIEEEYNYLVERLKKLGCDHITKPKYEEYSDNWYESSECYDLNTCEINVLCHRYTHLYTFLKEHIDINKFNNI